MHITLANSCPIAASLAQGHASLRTDTTYLVSQQAAFLLSFIAFADHRHQVISTFHAVRQVQSCGWPAQRCRTAVRHATE